MFGALALANEFVTNQVGHGAAQLFDPMLKITSGPISTVASLLGAAVFIGTNLHLILLINVTDLLHHSPRSGRQPDRGWPDVDRHRW